MVASSLSADSLLIPLPLFQNPLQSVQHSWSSAQQDSAAVLPLKLLLFCVCQPSAYQSSAHKQGVSML